MSEHLSHPHHDCSWCARSAKLQRWRINGLNLNDGLRTIRIERGTILFNAWAGRLKHGFGVCWEAIFLTGHSHSVATATHDSLTLLRSRKIGQSICAVHRYFTSSDVSSLRFPRFTVYNSPWLVSTSHLRNLGSWIKLPSHGDGTYTVIIKWYIYNIKCISFVVSFLCIVILLSDISSEKQLCLFLRTTKQPGLLYILMYLDLPTSAEIRLCWFKNLTSANPVISS